MTKRILSALKAEAPEITPFQLAILKRGEGGREIWVHDRAELFGADMSALGELNRLGMVERSNRPLPPGPPDFPAYVLTAAGVAALQSDGEGR